MEVPRGSCRSGGAWGSMMRMTAEGLSPTVHEICRMRDCRLVIRNTSKMSHSLNRAEYT